MAFTGDEWVEIWVAGQKSYCWNRRTSETSTDDAVVASWAGQNDAIYGKFYYWKIESSDPPVWILPELRPAQNALSDVRPPPPTDPPLAKEVPAVDCEPLPFSEPGTDDVLQVDESWVRVESSKKESVPYFWNFKLGVATATLPRGKSARWSGFCSDNDNAWYYVDVASGMTTWELPSRTLVPPSWAQSQALKSPHDDLQPVWLELGAPVGIVGLLMQCRCNGQVGVIIEAMSGRFIVRVADEGALCALKPENLRPLPTGTLVELVGLPVATLNGMVGTVKTSLQSMRSGPWRYLVRLPDGSEESLKGTNLKPRSRLWDLHTSLSPAGRGCHLRWRDEQSKIFIDSKGEHRSYVLHLPSGFDTTEFELVARWPLLVYMHGAGGGTFFTHSKKSLRTVGMQRAARSFVVITPRCEWTWRDKPSDWILELIQAFKALEWIDYGRIYLTGCSMGGMGVWELGARRPDLFAAISPVAAHHQRERTHWLAQRLLSTPVYAFHDDHDGTCPIAPEKVLWQLLQESGHQNFCSLVTTGVDHCKVHEQAYCNSEDLYNWFLEHRSPA